jgi:hypothetical protein
MTLITLNEHAPTPAAAAELLSDVLHAERAILYDDRAEGLCAQLTSYGMTANEVPAKLRALADEVEAHLAREAR